MVLKSLFPVFALIALGMVLKRWRLTTADFLKTSDRLVYFIFFPALLFWKIGGSPPTASATGTPFPERAFLYFNNYFTLKITSLQIYKLL